jgi:hypothetical protein
VYAHATPARFERSRCQDDPADTERAGRSPLHAIDIQVAGIGRLTHPAWTTALNERRRGNWKVVWEQTGAIGPLPLPS